MISGSGGLVDTGAGALTLSNTNTYSGRTVINGGTLDLAALQAAGVNSISFGAGSDTLKIENAALAAEPSVNSFGNAIQGFGVGDIIDLTGLTFAKGATASYNPHTDVLTVTSGGVADTMTLIHPGATTSLSSAMEPSGQKLH